MKARLVRRRRENLAGGFIVEVKIWELPFARPERPHDFKYSLFFGREGERIVGYDNESGKGDHRHYRDREQLYAFIDVDTLEMDFARDVLAHGGIEWRR